MRSVIEKLLKVLFRIMLDGRMFIEKWGLVTASILNIMEKFNASGAVFRRIVSKELTFPIKAYGAGSFAYECDMLRSIFTQLHYAPRLKCRPKRRQITFYSQKYSI